MGGSMGIAVGAAFVAGVKAATDARTPYVIFTDDASKKFEDYQGRDVTSTDENIGIRYTSEDIVGDTVLLRPGTYDLGSGTVKLGGNPYES